MLLKSPYPDIQVPEVDLWTLIFNRPNAKPHNHVPNDTVAFIDPIKQREYTFGQFRLLTQRFAKSLQDRLSLRKGDCLAIFSPNCPEYAFAVFGAVAAGGVISPASVAFGAAELSYQLKDCGAKALVTHASVLETALTAAKANGIETTNIFVIEDSGPSKPLSDGLVPFESLISTNISPAFVPPQIDVHKDLIALPYSSGTTGRPKGVCLTHYNVVSNVLSMAVGLNDGKPDFPFKNDRFIAILPYSHIYGLTVLLFVGSLIGRTQIVLPRFDLIKFLELTQKYRCNTGYIAPPVLTVLAKHPIVDKYDISSLQEGGLMCAAAPLSVPLIDSVYDRLKIPVYQAFGMTEASPATHTLTVQTWKEGKGSVGVILPSVECRIVDESGFDVSPGEPGEVWVRGPNIFPGYLNNAAATAECMTTDGFYKTGDIAKIDPRNGFFYITDRIKELIKYKGYQVPPAELESVLSGHAKIADVAVVGAWDEGAHTELPRAFVVLQAGHEPNKKLEAEIMKWVDDRVAHYKRLSGGVRFVSEIPKSTAGKILRRVLKQHIAKEAEAVSAKL